MSSIIDEEAAKLLEDTDSDLELELPLYVDSGGD